jgi:hypothetical protein
LLGGRKCWKRYDMGLKDSLLLRDLDKTLAIAGVILSLMLIVYLGREFSQVIYLLTGILALISCLLWLAIRKSHTFEFHLPESRTLTIVWSICFFGLYVLSVLSVYLRPELYERPLLYFILTALMAGIIACEIFTSGRRHAGLILIQILLLGVSIAWSQLLIFPSLLGVDPWYHSALTNRIINEGFIPEGYSYSKLPLFHLMIAATSLIAGLPYKFAAMASVSLGQIICNGVFVFLIANCLFKNHRIGLLAALMVIIANHHIIMSYWSIPNGFAAVFIPIVVYLVLSTAKNNPRDIKTLFMRITMILLMVAIILTHTIAATCMAILLFVAWGASTLYKVFYPRAESYTTLLVPFGFTVMMVAWWTYVSGHVQTLGQLIKWGFSIDFFVKTPPEFLNYAASVPLGEQLFNNLGMFLFFAFSFIGIFYMISRRGSSSSFAMAWVGLAPLAIGFFSLISGHSVIEYRWWYFAQILLSIPLAVAIYTVGTWKSKTPLHLYSFVFGFSVALSILMILSPPANVDNLSFSPNSHVRCSLTESELKSIVTLTDKWDGPIKSDAYFAGYPTIQYPQISAFCENIYSRDYLSLRDYITFIREDTVGKPFNLFSSIYKLEYDLNVKLDELGFSRIYDSNSGSGYRG